MYKACGFVSGEPPSVGSEQLARAVIVDKKWPRKLACCIHKRSYAGKSHHAHQTDNSTMIIFKETNRLILREIIPKDEVGFYELDSDAEVHKYIESKTIDTIEQARETIRFIRQQYIDNGIGRWAIIEKETNNFIGWTGLKLIRKETNNHINYYDLGYRLLKKYWGNGFATEAAIASLDYGFDKLALQEIYADANIENVGSNNVLRKVGLRFVETFEKEGIIHHWYQIKRDDWIKMSNR